MSVPLVLIIFLHKMLAKFLQMVVLSFSFFIFLITDALNKMTSVAGSVAIISADLL